NMELMRDRTKRQNVSRTQTLRSMVSRTLLFCAVLFSLACTPSLSVMLPGTVVAQAAVSETKLAKKANTIIKKQTKSGDSDLTKLKKLFKYAEKNWLYSRASSFTDADDTVQYAFSILKNNTGSCYHFAAGYAYLARQALGDNSKYKVRIAVGQTNGFGYGLQSHAWVEIRIKGTWYIFDSNLDKFAADSSLKYYKKKRSSKAMKKIYNSYKSVKYYTVSYTSV
ncbi:MAG: transglutaminase-like domain-containing protein, partial [Clostridiales bacterium]|nr:transglutaminase-like domain-containing protein [Clostridiales bacterium]